MVWRGGAGIGEIGVEAAFSVRGSLSECRRNWFAVVGVARARNGGSPPGLLGLGLYFLNMQWPVWNYLNRKYIYPIAMSISSYNLKELVALSHERGGFDFMPG